MFSEFKSYLLLIEPMEIDGKSTGSYSWDWCYRLKNIEFYKCLYLAAFMQKNNFPVPQYIVPSGNNQSCLQPASAIKYAMGNDWNKIYIYDTFGTPNKDRKPLNIAQDSLKFYSQMCELLDINKLSEIKFHIVLAPGILNDVYKYCDGVKPKSGDAILFSAKDLSELYTGIKNPDKKDLEYKYIECDESIIPNTNKLFEAKNNFDYTLSRSKDGADTGSISNKHSNLSEIRVSYLHEFVKTFKKQPYKFR